MKTWQEAALEYSAQGNKLRTTVNMIETEFGLSNMYGRVSQYLHKCRKNAKSDQKETNIKRVVVQNQEPEHHKGKWDGTQTIRFAVMGDTQFGSKYAQITHLHNFYDLCQQQGITDIYHTGDVTDGLKMRPGHEFELYENSADGQLDDVVKNYPKRDGITTHFITGNHDASLYKHVGFDIGRAIARDRDDMKYLGRDCAVINITPNCTLELRHPWDGTAYSISYKIQKMIGAMEDDSKPNILAVGYKDGSYSYLQARTTTTLKLEKEIKTVHLMLDFTTEEVPDETITVVKPQVELGSTATPFTPHVSDFSSVNVTRYGKNLLDMSKWIGKTVSQYGATLTFNEDGSVTGSGTPTGYLSSSVSDKLYLPLGKYRLSYTGMGKNIACSISLYNSSNVLIGSAAVYDSYKSTLIDLTDTTKYPDFSYLQYSFKRSVNNVELTGTVHFQLELGDTATEYEFALKPVAHTANADGTVTGIKSVSPNMVLMSNNEGIIMGCVYFKKDAE